jgi:hypothetical protein
LLLWANQEDIIIEITILKAIAVQHPEEQKNYTEILKRDQWSLPDWSLFGIDAVWVRIILFY